MSAKLSAVVASAINIIATDLARGLIIHPYSDKCHEIARHMFATHLQTRIARHTSLCAATRDASARGQRISAESVIVCLELHRLRGIHVTSVGMFK